MGVDALWWAADGTHKDDFFRVAADCSSSPAFKPLSWMFPAKTMCDTDKACTIDITVGAMSGANGASVFWTYTYVWKS